MATLSSHLLNSVDGTHANGVKVIIKNDPSIKYLNCHWKNVQSIYLLHPIIIYI